jgi:hypothetical protein
MANDRTHIEDVPEWIDAEACRLAGIFLEDTDLAGELEGCVLVGDAAFESLLGERRRELTAEGASPDEIAYRLAVMRHTRDSLILRAEIRALPTAVDGRPGARRRPSW